MAQFIQIGNRIINLELLTNVIYVPAQTNESRPFLVAYFANSAIAEQFSGSEADQLWNCLKDTSLILVEG